MINMESPLQIKRLDRQLDGYIEALHHVFDLPKPRAKDNIHPHISQLLGNNAPGDSSTSPQNTLYLYGAYLNEKLIATSLAIDSPGASAMAFISTPHASDITPQGTVDALSSLLTEAWERGMSMVEILLMPGSNVTAKIATQADFRFITRLLYLRRRKSVTKKVSDVANDIEWVCYSPNSEELFLRAVELTYAQSLDCPELTGIRPMEDVLAAHRSVGEHDPAFWWVATRSDEPVGVLLLSRIQTRKAMEIVYMGVSQAARGTGVADALLDRAIKATIGDDVSELALAVDRRNHPARRMYARWGFIEFSARDAWVASPPTSNL